MCIQYALADGLYVLAAQDQARNALTYVLSRPGANAGIALGVDERRSNACVQCKGSASDSHGHQLLAKRNS